MDRKREIELNLAAVRERIAAACAEAARSVDEITLIAVTKTYPASDVALLVELGVVDIGENRDQEAAPKALAVPQARWHFIGQLQRNKARSVASYASMVHSVDSVRLAQTLGGAATSPLDVLIQVSLDPVPGRGGAVFEEVPSIADTILEHEQLRLRGLMAVAPLGEDPRVAFERLNRYSTMFRADYPDATVLSAGMSEDLAAAIAWGATHVRIGSALLGKRSVLR
jgi:pyridoxal phosphate enzyme (YggS family)